MRCPVRSAALTFLLLAAASSGFAPAPIFKESKRDPAFVLQRLQGTWAMPRYDHGGTSAISMCEAYTIKIEKDEWTFFRSHNGGPLTKSSTYTLKLDPKTNPPEIDFVGKQNMTLVGTYDLRGDDLKIVFRIKGQGGRTDRAKDLTNPEPNDYLIELRRQP